MHGKRVRKGLISSILAVFLALGTVLTAFADYPGINLDEQGSITVSMKIESDGTETAVGGGEMTIYQVAEVHMDPDTGDYSYVVLDPFTGSSYDFEGKLEGKSGEDPDIDWAQLAQDFADYVYDEGISGESKEIDSDGTVIFDGLYPGLYLLVQTVPADGYYAANSFLVSMPTYTEDSGSPDYSYEVDASPKTETFPGPTKDVNVDEEEEKQYDDNGVIVGVGQTLTYRISYTNSHAVPATIVITDTHDENVEYVDGSASVPSSGYKDYDFKYENGTLTWTITDVPERESGEVTFQVLVLESAAVPGRVDNTATVKIDNDEDVETNPVWNPVPRKDVDVDTSDDKDYGDDGVQVTVGQTLTYKVEFQNGHEYNADVTITDELDPNVEYVDGSATGPDKYTYDVTYEDHTLTWVIKDVEGLDKGEVTFQVTVLRTARTPGEVVNDADVKVNNDSSVKTNAVRNPVPGGGSSRSGGGGGGGSGSGGGSGGGSGSGGPGGSGDGDSGGSSWDLLPLPQTGQGWAMLIAVCAMIIAGLALIVVHTVKRKG